MIANSQFKRQLLLREYGINVQNIAKYILTVPDRQERSRLAQLLVNLMARLNPNTTRDIQDYQQKLWNHLYVMTDGELDVDCPYPLSAMEYLNDKPQRMGYLLDMPVYKHYGKNVEKLIARACELENEEERNAAIISLGKLMKTLYKTYNKENITDEVILDNMRQLSKGKLDMDLATIERNNLFESVLAKPAQTGGQQNYQQQNQQRNKKPQDNKNRRKQN